MPDIFRPIKICNGTEWDYIYASSDAMSLSLREDYVWTTPFDIPISLSSETWPGSDVETEYAKKHNDGFFTIKKSGLYLCSMSISFWENTNDYIYAGMYNYTQSKWICCQGASSNKTGLLLSANGIARINAGDVVKLNAVKYTTATIRVQSGGKTVAQLAPFALD